MTAHKRYQFFQNIFPHMLMFLYVQPLFLVRCPIFININKHGSVKTSTTLLSLWGFPFYNPMRGPLIFAENIYDEHECLSNHHGTNTLGLTPWVLSQVYANCFWTTHWFLVMDKKLQTMNCRATLGFTIGHFCCHLTTCKFSTNIWRTKKKSFLPNEFLIVGSIYVIYTNVFAYMDRNTFSTLELYI